MREAGLVHLYRRNPLLRLKGQNPLQLDTKKHTRTVEEAMLEEGRFRQLRTKNPERFKEVVRQIQEHVDWRLAHLTYLSQEPVTAAN